MHTHLCWHLIWWFFLFVFKDTREETSLSLERNVCLFSFGINTAAKLIQSYSRLLLYSLWTGSKYIHRIRALCLNDGIFASFLLWSFSPMLMPLQQNLHGTFLMFSPLLLLLQHHCRLYWPESKQEKRVKKNYPTLSLHTNHIMCVF